MPSHHNRETWDKWYAANKDAVRARNRDRAKLCRVQYRASRKRLQTRRTQLLRDIKATNTATACPVERVKNLQEIDGIGAIIAATIMRTIHARRVL